MTDRIGRLVVALREAVSALDPARMPPAEAARLVDLLSEGERLCQAGRALAAARALEARTWRAAGFRTPAQWLAARTKKTLSAAITSVQTVNRLSEFPATREAFVSGRLSEIQAAEITQAAEADPRAEQRLLATAARESVATLRDRCREVRAAAVGDEDAVERVRRGRYLRHWSDRDGALRLDARLAPDDGARLIAAVTARAARLMQEARRSGQREAAEAYSADALVGLADGTPGPTAVVHVHVDHDALERGRTAPGEACTIPGIGPVPVASARRLAAGGVVKALASRGTDVRTVAHLGRGIPATLRTALETRDPTCVVPGCDVRSGLEGLGGARPIGFPSHEPERAPGPRSLRPCLPPHVRERLACPGLRGPRDPRPDGPARHENLEIPLRLAHADRTPQRTVPGPRAGDDRGRGHSPSPGPREEGRGHRLLHERVGRTGRGDPRGRHRPRRPRGADREASHRLVHGPRAAGLHALPGIRDAREAHHPCGHVARVLRPRDDRSAPTGRVGSRVPHHERRLSPPGREAGVGLGPAAHPVPHSGSPSGGRHAVYGCRHVPLGRNRRLLRLGAGLLRLHDERRKRIPAIHPRHGRARLARRAALAPR
ncbi:MAG: DUF222 domain-containing protein [Acidobacteria bacterium]|nr:DUF222 domain-containing protein [Acidobacteriota bacterium]